MQETATFQEIISFEPIQIDVMGYFYLFLCVVVVSIVLKVVITMFIQPKPKTFSKKEILFQQLKKLDFSSENQKQILYEFTLYSKELSSNQEEQKLVKILKQIESYKYHNKNIQIDPKIKQNMKRYIDEL